VQSKPAAAVSLSTLLHTFHERKRETNRQEEREIYVFISSLSQSIIMFSSGDNMFGCAYTLTLYIVQVLGLKPSKFYTSICVYFVLHGKEHGIWCLCLGESRLVDI